jgi:hypothetical protein
MLKNLLASSFGDDEPWRGMLDPPTASSQTRSCHLIFPTLQISRLSDPHASPLRGLHIPAHARAGSPVEWRDLRVAAPNGRALHHCCHGIGDHPGSLIHLLPRTCFLFSLRVMLRVSFSFSLIFPEGYLLLGC